MCVCFLTLIVSSSLTFPEVKGELSNGEIADVRFGVVFLMRFISRNIFPHALVADDATWSVIPSLASHVERRLKRGKREADERRQKHKGG